MQIRRVLLLCLFPALVGCGPSVLDNREVSMDVGEIVPIVFGPFNRGTTITVSAESPGAPISVYVHPADQTEHVDYAISFGKEPQDVYAGVASTESVTLTADVPPETEVAVRLQPVGQAKATVQLKITN